MRATLRAGSWVVLGERERFELARPSLEASAAAAHGERGPRRLGELETFLKASPFPTRPALRHAARRALGLPIPRLAEFANLEWLRERDFLAPRPVLAGARWRGFLPRYQFLFTELRPGEPTLEHWLPLAPPARRTERLVALAQDLARLHCLGFVHRDLFGRNLLVPAVPGEARCVFLDAWRGGPGPGLRGPDHDLGCLLLEGASQWTAEEQGLFLAVYREESGRLGRGLPGDWPLRVERARAAVHRREARRRSGLAPAWSFPHPG